MRHPETVSPACQAVRAPLAIGAEMHQARQCAMATHKLLLLPGDGIGPEVMAEVTKLIAFMNAHGLCAFETEEALVGGSCYDLHKLAITDATMAKAHAADAVIFGAVGGPNWDGVPYDVRPEAGLLRLRKELGLFANIRPAICYPALAESSSLKREVVDGLDIIILRELTGGVYFGEPKTIIDLGNGQKRAVDTQVYDTYEIERIARVAFELVRWPKQFDVIVTDNLFGDMLSDIAAMLTGSLGMLPSASLGEVDAKTKKRKAMYEPVHGSAPDIAGKGIANPIAMLASFGMALRYSLNMAKEADQLDAAIAAALAQRLRTADIKSEGTKVLTTTEMGDAIVGEMKKL